MSTLLILRSWIIAWLHLSSRCFLLMRSAEGCIVGLASVRPNFLRLTFDPRAEGASLSLSRSCHVSPAAEETSSGSVETRAISTAPAALVFQEVTSAQRATVGCHLFVIRVTTSDLWPSSRRDGKGSAGHLRFRRRQAAAQSCCSQSSLSSHIFCLNRFIFCSLLQQRRFSVWGSFYVWFYCSQGECRIEIPLISFSTKHADALQTVFNRSL